MAKFTVEISDTEEKALLSEMVSIQDWASNVIHAKARACIARIVASEIVRMQRDPTIDTIPSSKEAIMANAIVKPAVSGDFAEILPKT